ncbi:MAG: dolichyl-phosphate beta-glucosyltransferase [Polyangiaceae bacterium]
MSQPTWGPEASRSEALVPRSRVPEVSIVIPAYNEARRIVPTLASRIEYFDARSLPYEIIVVDDGSRDSTAAVVREVARWHASLRLIRLPSNLGKGAAVRTGVRNAAGQLVLLDDADGATPIAEFSRLREAVDAGADVAIGSRAFPGEQSKIERRLLRFVTGRVFAFVVNRWVVPGIADTQCGFKLFKGAVARRIFALQQLDGFAFDVEALHLAQVFGHTVAEVPIHWADVPGSKVSVATDSLRMLWDVLRTPLVVRRSLNQGAPLLPELEPEPLQLGSPSR